VALEDVFQHSILQSSRDDVANLRRVLQRAGPTGWQAWRELQGATLRHIQEQATKNVARDSRNNPVISAAAMDRAVRGLDQDGKLQFIFGKNGAQRIRDLNEVTKTVMTTPPGTVNTSNTAAALLNALSIPAITGGAAEGGLMMMLTGMPVPVLTLLKSTIKAAKATAENRRLLQRVNEALGKASAAKNQRPPARHVH
jgi:hypothetical protein